MDESTIKGSTSVKAVISGLIIYKLRINPESFE